MLYKRCREVIFSDSRCPSRFESSLLAARDVGTEPHIKRIVLCGEISLNYEYSKQRPKNECN